MASLRLKMEGQSIMYFENMIEGIRQRYPENMREAIPAPVGMESHPSPLWKRWELGKRFKRLNWIDVRTLRRSESYAISAV
mmetsp:Transcript_12711/g.26926  ORF Transcript_12711/g.26926 Transcript_12711/m.26926 type:complete len:81 (+) Transcript_12711:1140-1382(+)